MNTPRHIFSVFFLSIMLAACTGGGGGGGGGGGNSGPIDLWTWVSGSDTYAGGQAGVYGTISVVDATNIPGARQGAMSWTDTNGDFWLFGGWGYDSSGSGTPDRLNDLWRWDGTNWTWISGSDTAAGAKSPTYGNIGVTDAANVPGGRNDAVTWIDSNGDFWLFGGVGYDSSGGTNPDRLNDLWRFDVMTEEWTWMSGSETFITNGTYGTIGVADPSNVPGSRAYAMGWIDASDNLWLFGGSGFASSGNFGRLNDLWRWDVTTEEWTWISGSGTRNQTGNYGTQGIADPANVPRARQTGANWIDTNGNFWLFGGADVCGGTLCQLNDLWRWDVTTEEWTWISGSDMVDQMGSYGTRGTADANNIPGARLASASSTDASGNVWLFGGQGIDGSGTPGRLNDLWRWNGTQWTWISGSVSADQDGIYGIQGSADTANVPGVRSFGVSWIDTNGNFWLFGGFGYDSSGSGSPARLNDLWRYQP